MMRRRHGRRRGGEEDGVALIATLCFLATAGVLALSLAALSQKAAFGNAAEVGRMRSFYLNEGVANRVRYLIEADRSAYPLRRPDEVDFDDYDFDRYFADSFVHTMDYYGTPVRFVIHNGVRGIDLNSREGIDVLQQNRLTDTVVADALELFSTRLTDYMDSDDSPGTDGLEKDDYDALNCNNLPRNDAMQFKEELFWIPGALEVTPVDGNGDLSIVRNLQISNGGNPSIFAATYVELRTIGGLDEIEAATVYDALREWRKNRTKLSDQLDVLTLPLLQQRFSWEDSRYYTIEILRPEQGVGAGLRCTFQTQGVGGPSNGIAPYLEYSWF